MTFDNPKRVTLDTRRWEAWLTVEHQDGRIEKHAIMSGDGNGLYIFDEEEYKEFEERGGY